MTTFAEPPVKTLPDGPPPVVAPPHCSVIESDDGFWWGEPDRPGDPCPRLARYAVRMHCDAGHTEVSILCPEHTTEIINTADMGGDVCHCGTLTRLVSVEPL